ncbi:MAG: RNA degradosome polyphosphate kinase [Chloroflexi bacterium RBG_16_57_11]|nr:MAG: RNA degradosome polyphosphate kinase [Chloroflexi bacterium RBG_16_57_11]
MTDLVEMPIEEQEDVGDSKIDLHDPQLYINRELSLLEFHRRVLEEAQDHTNPLLERVKFLSIVGSNLDEFFMVRVTGLRKQVDAGVVDVSADGIPPTRVLAEIRKLALQMMTEARDCLNDDLLPSLRRSGIYVMDYQALTDRQKASVDAYFDEVISKVITPLAFDPGHPFPHISNLSLNLAVVIRDEKGQERFARVKVPRPLSRLVPLKRSSGGLRKDGTPPQNHYFIWVEQLIAANLYKLFPGMQLIEAHPFRVTRDADMIIQELEAADLLESIEQSVRQRRFGSVTRLTVNDAMPSRIRDILVENLEMDRRDVYTVSGPLGLSDLMDLHNVGRPDLKDLPLRPTIPPELKSDLRDTDLFTAIRNQDILVHHPYDSFRPVIDFLRLAASDPDVLAIKQTLYRVGRNSPVVEALLEARQNGKEVAVLVELKARFDEESNIGWARTLEKEGVHVIYGLLGLKTHSKIALVVRKEGEHIRRYLHLATGNYNSITAQIYEDIGMFTCDEDTGADATDLFNYLTGYSAKRDYKKLLVAPVNLRSRMEDLIEREIAHQKAGGCGHMIFKMNALVDPRMIRKLYKASQAGVKIDLIVRGMCCLRPGVPGISENVHVISVVGRFLEHSRIYYFCNGGNEEIYLGSADLMPRNINWRVEVLFPVQDRRIIRYLTDDVLKTYLAANTKTRILQPDGIYTHPRPDPGEPALNPQEWLIQHHQPSKS